ncbi:MAG: hypothetical protein J2P25_20910, partial [Nocardiopsaceae bacterium]|nr:hypothetical protein [Nocardiopsaceae bacterium]
PAKRALESGGGPGAGPGGGYDYQYGQYDQYNGVGQYQQYGESGGPPWDDAPDWTPSPRPGQRYRG